jgi:hypothetical protein
MAHKGLLFSDCCARLSVGAPGPARVLWSYLDYPASFKGSGDSSYEIGCRSETFDDMAE